MVALVNRNSVKQTRMKAVSVGNVLLVGVGGFIGSVLRYWISEYVQQVSKSGAFPYGTLAVNVIGCFLIGFLAQLAETRGLLSAETRAFVVVGVLGGFTTFSTFGHESMNLLRDGQNGFAFANVGPTSCLVSEQFGSAAHWSK